MNKAVTCTVDLFVTSLRVQRFVFLLELVTVKNFDS